MAKGYPMGGGAAYNILDLPAPPRDLVVTTAPATIKVQFNAAGEEAWIVYKPGGKPRHPYDGWHVISKNGGGYAPCTASLVEHVENDVEYGVRVFVRGRYGFQTSREGTTATVTPRAGLLLGDMATDPPTMITLTEDGAPQRYRVLVHNYCGNLGRSLVMRETLTTDRMTAQSGGLYIGSALDAAANTYPDRLSPDIVAKVLNIALPCQTSTSDLTAVGTYQRRAFVLSFREFGATDSTVPDFLPKKLILMGDPIPYFATIANRIMLNSRGSAAWHYTRDAVKMAGVTGGTFYYGAVHSTGSFTTSNGPVDVYPAICFTLPSNMIFNMTPNADGSYSPIL